jgi:NAD(P)-dependent dehydrogenase (short-subunit alcohol dehydrogenase family)
MSSTKVALVTGGTSGIGRATAIALANRGVRVVISGRRQPLGRQVVDEIAARGGEAAFVSADVTDELQVRRMIEFAVETYGSLNIAVNNAGIANETKRIDDSDLENFRAMLETNVVGLYLCMKYEVRQMLASGGGSIVNLASIAGLNGIPYLAPYTATKHAVIGLTKSSALEYATQNIRINAVAPGVTDTALVSGLIALGVLSYPQSAAMQPMGRMGTSEETASAIAWLASDEASFVTGHVLNVDGGFQAK